MTHEQFTEYCIQNKPSCIAPHEWGYLKITFENGEYILVGATYDGFSYSHQYDLSNKNTSGLLKDLLKMYPDVYERMNKKYGDMFPPEIIK